MDSHTNLKDIVKEPGVADITPTTARNYFALAVKAERMGDDDRAAEKLQQAVEAETRPTVAVYNF